MPSSTFAIVQQFSEDLAKKKHDFSADTFKVALVNAARSLTVAVLADVTEISYTNCSSRTIAGITSEQTAGVTTLTMTDLVLTASGGSVGPFRAIYVYNDTAAGDLIVGGWDYGSALTLLDGQTLTIDVGASGLGTIA